MMTFFKKSSTKKKAIILVTFFIALAFLATIISFSSENVQAQQLGCCLKTKDNEFCSDKVTRDQCEEGFFFTGKTCDDINQCRAVTCIHTEGECQANIPQFSCQYERAKWDERPLEEVEACQTGGCNIGNVICEVLQKKVCEDKAKQSGFPLSEVKFTAGLTELEVKKQCIASGRGTCELGGGACEYTTADVCANKNGKFNQNILPSQVSACGISDAQERKGCGILPGDENKVFWFNDQGAQEALVQDCGYPQAFCKEEVVQGQKTAVCKSTACEFTLKEEDSEGRKGRVKLLSGTSICYNFNTDINGRSTGLQHQILHCVNGNISVEGLGPDRNKRCVDDFGKKKLDLGATARVVDNLWQKCRECGSANGNLVGKLGSAGLLASMAGGFVSDGKGTKQQDFSKIFLGLSLLGGDENRIGDTFQIMPLTVPPGPWINNLIGSACGEKGGLKTIGFVEDVASEFGFCKYESGLTGLGFALGGIGSAVPKVAPGNTQQCNSCGGGGDALWNVCDPTECNALGDCEASQAFKFDSVFRMWATGAVVTGAIETQKCFVEGGLLDATFKIPAALFSSKDPKEFKKIFEGEKDASGKKTKNGVVDCWRKYGKAQSEYYDRTIGKLLERFGAPTKTDQYVVDVDKLENVKARAVALILSYENYDFLVSQYGEKGVAKIIDEINAAKSAEQVDKILQSIGADYSTVLDVLKKGPVPGKGGTTQPGAGATQPGAGATQPGAGTTQPGVGAGTPPKTPPKGDGIAKPAPPGTEDMSNSNIPSGVRGETYSEKSVAVHQSVMPKDYVYYATKRHEKRYVYRAYWSTDKTKVLTYVYDGLDNLAAGKSFAAMIRQDPWDEEGVVVLLRKELSQGDYGDYEIMQIYDKDKSLVNNVEYEITVNPDELKNGIVKLSDSWPPELDRGEAPEEISPAASGLKTLSSSQNSFLASQGLRRSVAAPLTANVVRDYFSSRVETVAAQGVTTNEGGDPGAGQQQNQQTPATTTPSKDKKDETPHINEKQEEVYTNWYSTSKVAILGLANLKGGGPEAGYTCKAETPLRGEGTSLCKTCASADGLRACTKERCEILGLCKAVPKADGKGFNCVEAACEQSDGKKQPSVDKIEAEFLLFGNVVKKVSGKSSVDVGALPWNVTEVRLKITTNVGANCRFSTQPGAAWSSSVEFEGAAEFPREQQVTLGAGGAERTHNIYIKCQNVCGIETPGANDGFFLRYEKGKLPDFLPPEIAGIDPYNVFVPEVPPIVTTQVFLSENGACFYTKNLTVKDVALGGQQMQCAQNQKCLLSSTNTCATCKFETDVTQGDLMDFEQFAQIPEANAASLVETARKFGLEKTKVTRYVMQCQDVQGNKGEIQPYMLSTVGNYNVTILAPAPGFETFDREVTLRANTTHSALCKYSLDVEKSFKDMTAITEEHGLSHETLIGNLSVGEHNIFVTCEDFARQARKASMIFKVKLDTQGPILIRAFRDFTGTGAAVLKIVTDEVSSCRYSINNPSFTWESGIEMPFDNSQEHLGDWGFPAYYIRCRDRFSNEMYKIVKPSEIS